MFGATNDWQPSNMVSFSFVVCTRYATTFVPFLPCVSLSFFFHPLRQKRGLDFSYRLKEHTLLWLWITTSVSYNKMAIGPLARLLAQLVVPVVAVLARAIPAAYGQALQNARKAGVDAAEASAPVFGKRISRSEALQVLNLSEAEAIKPEVIQKVGIDAFGTIVRNFSTPHMRFKINFFFSHILHIHY